MRPAEASFVKAFGDLKICNHLAVEKSLPKISVFVLPRIKGELSDAEAVSHLLIGKAQ